MANRFMYLITLYVIPFLVAFPLVITKLKGFLLFIKDIQDCPESRWEEEIKKRLSKTDKFGKSISELENEPIFLISSIRKHISNLWALFIFPVFVLRMALISRLGLAIVWRMPISLYELWALSFLGMSFYYSNNGLLHISVPLAVIVTVIYINDIASEFERKNGVLKIVAVPEHKLRISSLVEYAVIVTTGFAAIYYSISVYDPEYFSEPLTVFSSIYFSIVTVSTVGYGDITPIHWIPRVFVILQVILGFIYIVILVSIFVSILSVRFGKNDSDQDT